MMTEARTNDILGVRETILIKGKGATQVINLFMRDY